MVLSEARILKEQLGMILFCFVFETNRLILLDPIGKKSKDYYFRIVMSAYFNQYHATKTSGS